LGRSPAHRGIRQPTASTKRCSCRPASAVMGPRPGRVIADIPDRRAVSGERRIPRVHAVRPRYCRDLSALVAESRPDTLLPRTRLSA
jgi:hypothetical protein